MVICWNKDLAWHGEGKPVCTLEGHQLIRHWQIHTPSCCDSSVWHSCHLHVSPWCCRWRDAIRSHDGGCGLDQVCGAAACRPLGLGMASHDRWWWWRRRRRRDGNDNDDDNDDWRRTTDDGQRTTDNDAGKEKEEENKEEEEEEMRRRWGGDEEEMRRRWGGGDDDDDDDDSDGWRMTDAGWWMMDGGSMMDDRWPMVDDRWSMMILQSHHCRYLLQRVLPWRIVELKQIQDFSGRFVETANMSSRVADVAQDRSREKNQEEVSFLIQRVAELYCFFSDSRRARARAKGAWFWGNYGACAHAARTQGKKINIFFGRVPTEKVVV